MKRNIFLIFALLVILGAVVHAQLSDDALGKPNSVTISTSGNTVKMDSTTNTVKAEAMGTVSASTTNASTTAVTVTNLTGRDWIEVSVGYNGAMTNQVWVGIGTTTVAVGTGRLVSIYAPLKIHADDGVVFSTIASEACYMCVSQGKYD